MEQHQQLLNASILLQNEITQDKATKTRHRPPASNPCQESDVQKDHSKSNEVSGKRSNSVIEASSLLQIDEAVWRSENESLEDEFLALKTILSSYVALQTRIFHDLGGSDSSCRNAETADSEGAHDRALVLSDAVRYIQCLEELQHSLVDEKFELESKVSRWEKGGV